MKLGHYNVTAGRGTGVAVRTGNNKPVIGPEQWFTLVWGFDGCHSRTILTKGVEVLGKITHRPAK